MSPTERRLVDAAQEALQRLQDRYGIHKDNFCVKGLSDAVREALEPANGIVQKVAGNPPATSGF